MRWTSAAAGVLAATMTVGSALADEAEANRLLVEAVGLAQQAERAPHEEAVALYAQAAANLDAIVADHPDTTMAVLITTHQPIGAFRAWEVRHELARLSASRGSAAPVPSAAVEPWERRFGDGTANVLNGETAHFMTDLLLRDDRTAVVVGTRWQDGVREVWLTAYGADGTSLWERTYAGTPCGAALIEDGIAVLATELIDGETPGVMLLLDDGLAPTGFPVGFEPHDIASDGRGGLLVMGSKDGAPIVSRYRSDGNPGWTWTGTGEIVPGAVGGALTAAAAIPGSDNVRVVGFANSTDDTRPPAVAWTGLLDGDGMLSDARPLGEIEVTGLRPCDYAMHVWSVDAVDDGFIVRYDHIEPYTSTRLTEVLRLDAEGVEQWRRVHPIDIRNEPDPAAAQMAGVYEVTAVSGTSGGGAVLAGLLNRPGGRGGGFVARWDAQGNEMWMTELRRPLEPDGPVSDAYFAEVAEAADGAVMAVMTDGVRHMRPRAFVFRLGPDGEAP